MDAKLKALTKAYSDGSISRAELLQLEALLQGNPAARAGFLHEMNLTDTLEEIAVAAQPLWGVCDCAVPPALSSSSSSSPRSVRVRRASLTAAAAALVVLASGVWLRSGEATIGAIVEHQGRVRWTGHDGIVNAEPAAGLLVPGGTLELLGPDSWASFRFHDGSLLTFSGESEAVLSDRDQKRLHLRRGSMSAEVEPQPADVPLLVHTSTADLEVLGTQFNVFAQPARTELVVHEGLVRLQRSSDRKALDVAAKHRAVASLTATDTFTSEPRGPQLATWQSRLDSDANVRHGSWKPAVFSLATRLKQAVAKGTITEAEALAEYKYALSLDDQGTVWSLPTITGSLVWLEVRDDADGRVVLTEDTQIRVSGRLRGGSTLTMGVSVYAAAGGFLGKCSTSVSAEEVERSADGRFVWVVDGRDLTPQPGPVAGHLLIHDWWCVADAKSAALEVLSVDVQNH